MSSHLPIIIFDFDGVILPSTGARLALLRLLNDSRYNWDKNEVKKYHTLDLIRWIENVDSDKNTRMGFEIFSKFKDILPNPFDRIRFLVTLQRKFRKSEYMHGEFFPFVIPTLKKLQTHAIIGICTNSEKKRIIRWLQHYSISDLITAFTTRNDRKIYGVKPNPKILLYALVQIKRNKHIIGKLDKSKVYFVGDNVSDVLTAQNAGVKSIAVLSGSASKEELQQVSPDYILSTIEDIFSIPDLSHNR